MSTRASCNKNVDPLPKTGAPDAPRELPGTVCTQYVRCGKATCRCASGDRADLHGPYHYRFWREGGRLRKAYVPSVRLAATQAACERRQNRQRQHRHDRQAFRALLAACRTHAREVETLLATRGGS